MAPIGAAVTTCCGCYVRGGACARVRVNSFWGKSCLLPARRQRRVNHFVRVSVRYSKIHVVSSGHESATPRRREQANQEISARQPRETVGLSACSARTGAPQRRYVNNNE